MIKVRLEPCTVNASLECNVCRKVGAYAVFGDEATLTVIHEELKLLRKRLVGLGWKVFAKADVCSDCQASIKGLKNG